MSKRATPPLSPSGWIGGVMVAVFVVLGIIGPWVAPYSATRLDLDHQFLPPSSVTLSPSSFTWILDLPVMRLRRSPSHALRDRPPGGVKVSP